MSQARQKKTCAGRVLQAKDRWDHTYRFLHSDGAVRWMQSLGRADRDAAGHVTRLTGLELDVTERRRTEEALQARRDEEHVRAVRTLLETATQGIISADARGVLVFANPAVEVMFGWAAVELIGQPIERLIPSVFRDGMYLAGSLDLVGARMDGVDATARIRTELSGIRILGVSMLARSETADAIEHAGAAGFFVKGTDTQRLIDYLLALHAARGADV